MKDPKKKIRHKVGDILAEILIIIFAVWITIYFEKSREHAQEKKIKTEFLKGYRSDLLKDMKEMAGDTSGYASMQHSFIQLVNIEDLSEDSITLYMSNASQSVEFTPNSSRFEALKAAGKLTAIENAELLTAMFNLYQKEIPYLKSFGTGSFNEYKQQQIQPFYHKVFKRDKQGKTINWKEVVQMNEMRNYILYSIGKIFEIQSRYRTVINSYQKILDIIDHEENK